MAAFPVSRRQFGSQPPIFDPEAIKRNEGAKVPPQALKGEAGPPLAEGIGDILAAVGGLIPKPTPNINKSGAEQTGEKE